MFKKKRKKTAAIILLIVVFISSLYLFTNFCNNHFHSDYVFHLRNAKNNIGSLYSIMCILIRICLTVFHSNESVAVLMSIIVVLTILVCAWFIKKTLFILNIDIEYIDSVFVSISTIYICKLCVSDMSEYYYFDSISTQPWHNSTYTLMRCFSLVSMYYFLKIQKNYLEKIEIKDWIFFSVSLTLSNLAKPSFLLCFAPMMLITLIIDFIKTRGKSFKQAFLFGMCVIVSLPVCFYQSSVLFPKGGNFGVIFTLEKLIEYFASDIKRPIYLILNFAFPLLVSILMIKNRKRANKYSLRMLLQAWSMCAISLIESLTLFETGTRSLDGNFGWSNLISAYLLFIICIVLVKYMKRNNITKDENIGMCKIIYVEHIIMGIWYFLLMCRGVGYLY